MKNPQKFASSLRDALAIPALIGLTTLIGWLHQQDKCKSLWAEPLNNVAQERCWGFAVDFVIGNVFFILFIAAIALAALLPGLIALKERGERDARAEERDARAEKRHAEILGRIDETARQTEQRADEALALERQTTNEFFPQMMALLKQIAANTAPGQPSPPNQPDQPALESDDASLRLGD